MEKERWADLSVSPPPHNHTTMYQPNKTKYNEIKPQVKFQDQDPQGEALVRFTVNVYWATQFHVRTPFIYMCVYI